MTAVLMAVCLLTGFAIGWLTKRHRLGLLAENNHWVGEEIEALKGADLDADVAAERALRLSGDTPAVELYDQDAQPDIDPDDPHGCPGCLGTLVALDDGSRWCPRCTSFWDQIDIDCPEAGGCRRPEQCETGCYWRRLDALNQPITHDDIDVMRAGFRGYEGCPSGDCTTPFQCSERGDCRRWPEAIGADDSPDAVRSPGPVEDDTPQALPQGRLD